VSGNGQGWALLTLLYLWWIIFLVTTELGFISLLVIQDPLDLFLSSLLQKAVRARRESSRIVETVRKLNPVSGITCCK